MLHTTMNPIGRFSVTLLPLRVRLYTCSMDVFQNVIQRYEFYRIHVDVLTMTLLHDEVTLYLYVRPEDPMNQTNHQLLQRTAVSDPRLYYVFDIHEDLPGINHVGIIYAISHYFLEKAIPILYVNTYGHNLVFVSEDHYEQARNILEDISYLS